MLEYVHFHFSPFGDYRKVYSYNFLLSLTKKMVCKASMSVDFSQRLRRV